MTYIGGAGIELRRWNNAASPAAWEKLENIQTLTPSGQTAEDYDTTTLDTTGSYRTSIASFKEPGEIALDMLFERDSYDTLFADYESADQNNWEIVYPDADNTTIEFVAYVKACPMPTGADDVTRYTAVLKCVGEPTLNSGSGSGP